MQARKVSMARERTQRAKKTPRPPEAMPRSSGPPPLPALGFAQHLRRQTHHCSALRWRTPGPGETRLLILSGMVGGSCDACTAKAGRERVCELLEGTKHDRRLGRAKHALGEESSGPGDGGTQTRICEESEEAKVARWRCPSPARAWHILMPRHIARVGWATRTYRSGG